jgi:hypothetical protein
MAVGLPTGVSTQKQLMDAGANYLITSIADLPKLVETIKLLPRRKLREHADLLSG